MADQTIPSTGGDAIKNVAPEQWKKTSNCPTWVDINPAWFDNEPWVDSYRWVDGGSS